MDISGRGLWILGAEPEPVQTGGELDMIRYLLSLSLGCFSKVFPIFRGLEGGDHSLHRGCTMPLHEWR